MLVYIDVECFRHWVHDESYWEMNESLRVCPDITALVFKSTASPIVCVIKEIRNLRFFVFRHEPGLVVKEWNITAGSKQHKCIITTYYSQILIYIRRLRNFIQRTSGFVVLLNRVKEFYVVCRLLWWRPTSFCDYHFN